jgi:hypothetical protein
MPRLTKILDDRAHRAFAVCIDGTIEGFVSTARGATDLLDTLTDQLRTRPAAAVVAPFAQLHIGDDVSGNPLPHATVRDLYEGAFGPAFQRASVTYDRGSALAWNATFAWNALTVDLRFTLPDLWRVSMVNGIDSVPFVHTDCAAINWSRLTAALQRLN